MKNKITRFATLTLLLNLSCFTLFAQDSTYNKTLADSLGADDYGMRMYQLIILKTGTVTIENKEEVQKIFRGHMENISRLAEEGKLIVAGPLAANEQSYRGIFIFRLEDKSEIDDLLQSDPAISSGLLDADVYDWYGSAALPMYLPYSDAIQVKKP